MLAAGGFILLAFMLFANSNAKVITVLRSKRLVIILIPLYKNLLKLTLPSNKRPKTKGPSKKKAIFKGKKPIFYKLVKIEEYLCAISDL